MGISSSIFRGISSAVARILAHFAPLSLCVTPLASGRMVFLVVLHQFVSFFFVGLRFALAHALTFLPLMFCTTRSGAHRSDTDTRADTVPTRYGSVSLPTGGQVLLCVSSPWCQFLARDVTLCTSRRALVVVAASASVTALAGVFFFTYTPMPLGCTPPHLSRFGAVLLADAFVLRPFTTRAAALTDAANRSSDFDELWLPSTRRTSHH